MPGPEENTIDENQMFRRNLNETETDDDDFDTSEFRNDNTPAEEIPAPTAPANPPAEQTAEEEKEEEEEDSFNFGEEEEEQAEGDITDEDLASLNAKFGTDFKSAEEFRTALKAQDNKADDKTDEQKLESAETTLDYYQKLVDPQVMNDEGLMRKQYEMVAAQEGKDLNDEDVQYEIENQLQEIIDNRTIGLHAKNLRRDIKELKIDPALNTKQEIVKRKEEAENALKRTRKENIENAVVDIHNSKSFFGINPDKKTLSKVYKSVNSGEFLEKVKGDPKLATELAAILEYREEIYKKSSGLTYSDGLKAAIDAFEKNEENNTASTLTKAQRRGTSGSASTQQGLISALTSDK